MPVAPAASAPSGAEVPKVRLGISSCLLGQEVRYNGGHKRDSLLTDTFGKLVEWVPVCPEVELGLGTPRPPIRLERHGGAIRLVMPSTGEDYTEAMRSWAQRRADALAGLDLDGYVLKKDSPSCGMDRVKVYHGPGAPLQEGRGLFAAVLLARLPHLPVEEEEGLRDPWLREGFITRVFVHLRWREGERAGWSRETLRGFHERHRLLLMARNQSAARRLGLLLEGAGEEAAVERLAEEYRAGLTRVLARAATRRGHAHVLAQLEEHLSFRLGDEDRRELSGAIESYRRGLAPLRVPLTLIRHHLRRLDATLLRDQVYLDPHPHELMLSSHA